MFLLRAKGLLGWPNNVIVFAARDPVGNQQIKEIFGSPQWRFFMSSIRSVRLIEGYQIFHVFCSWEFLLLFI